MKRILACTAGLTVLLSAAPALADAGPTVGVGVARTSDYNRGTFFVPVWTDATGATVTSVTAALRDNTGVVDTIPLTQDASDPNFWTNTTPLSLASDNGGPMPHLGKYAIDVTATDSLSNTYTQNDAGTLDFTLIPQFQTVNTAQYSQLAFNPSTIDRGHHDVSVSGTLQGIEPGTGHVVPVANELVTITRSYTSTDPVAEPDVSTTATTAADGSFTTSSPFSLDWNATFRATISANDDQVDGVAYGGGTPNTSPTTVYITASADKSRVEPGQTFTVTGVVHTGSVTGPALPGIGVDISLSSYPQLSQRRVVADGNGQFTTQIVAVAGGAYTSWSVMPDDFLISGSPDNVPITIPDEASYSGVLFTLNSQGWVSASYSLAQTYDRNSAIYQNQVTYLQYSANGTTNWKTLRSASNTYGGTVGAWGYASGYYRLYHPVSDELAHAYSSVVHLSRIPTRVWANVASPNPVHKGGTVTDTGTLQQYSAGAWHAMAYRPIYLFFQPSGTTTWYREAYGKTDAYGRAKLHATATRSGKWLLQYFGDATHFDSDGTPYYVGVS